MFTSFLLCLVEFRDGLHSNINFTKEFYFVNKFLVYLLIFKLRAMTIFRNYLHTFMISKVIKYSYFEDDFFLAIKVVYIKF